MTTPCCRARAAKASVSRTGNGFGQVDSGSPTRDAAGGSVSNASSANSTSAAPWAAASSTARSPRSMFCALSKDAACWTSAIFTPRSYRGRGRYCCAPRGGSDEIDDPVGGAAPVRPGCSGPWLSVRGARPTPPAGSVRDPSRTTASGREDERDVRIGCRLQDQPSRGRFEVLDRPDERRLGRRGGSAPSDGPPGHSTRRSHWELPARTEMTSQTSKNTVLRGERHPSTSQSGGVDRKIQPFAARPMGTRREHNTGATLARARQYNGTRRVGASTSMNSTTATTVASTTQTRPSVAKLRRSLSVRTRLTLLITLAVALVIGVQAIIEIGIFERTVERDLLETARLTAVTVADDFELRRDPIDIDSLGGMLHEFAVSAPAIRTVSIISVDRRSNRRRREHVVRRTIGSLARREARRGRAPDGRRGRSARQHDRRDAGAARRSRRGRRRRHRLAGLARPAADERAAGDAVVHADRRPAPDAGDRLVRTTLDSSPHRAHPRRHAARRRRRLLGARVDRPARRDWRRRRRTERHARPSATPQRRAAGAGGRCDVRAAGAQPGAGGQLSARVRAA